MTKFTVIYYNERLNELKQQILESENIITAEHKFLKEYPHYWNLITIYTKPA